MSCWGWIDGAVRRWNRTCTSSKQHSEAMVVRVLEIVGTGRRRCGEDGSVRSTLRLKGDGRLVAGVWMRVGSEGK